MSTSQNETLMHIQTLLRHYAHRLTGEEATFLRDMQHQLQTGGRAPTQRQQAWLDRLVARHLGDDGLTAAEDALWV